jgi:flagellar basal-body rod protein FlgG
MYTAAAGMAAQQERLDAAANDLANVSTTGYKPVRVAFRDLVYTAGALGTDRGVGLGAGAAATAIGRSAQQGTLTETGQPLDVALSGPGFLQVRGPDGRPSLTRDGHLQTDERGRLRTQSGLLVDPAVTIPKGTAAEEISIAADGTVRAANRTVGRLRIVDVPAPAGLQGGPDNTFRATAASGALRAAAGTRVTQGSLESSGTDTATAMTDMIEAQRGFELASRAISMQDQMAEIANGVKK